MAIKVQGEVVITDDKKGVFDQVNPGVYTTAERDALSPVIGDILFNSDDEELQVWDGTDWSSAGSGSGSGTIGKPVEVLTPVDGAGVGGAKTYTAQTDVITSIDQSFQYGKLTESEIGLSIGNDWFKIVEGNNGRILAAIGTSGSSATISYSDDDGNTWTGVSSPLNNLNSLYFTGTHYIAANNQSIMFSTDGITWQTRAVSILSTVSDMACNEDGSIIVCVGNGSGDDDIVYSTNMGTTWNVSSREPVPPPGSTDNRYHPAVTLIEYGNGRFVTGQQFEERDSATPSQRRTIPEYSTNGASFSNSSAYPGDTNMTSFIFSEDRGLFIGTGSDYHQDSPSYRYTRMAWSTDGDVWSYGTVRNKDDTNYPPNRSLCSGRGVVLMGRNTGGYSYVNTSDLTSQISETVSGYSTNRIYGVGFAKDRFWCVFADVIAVTAPMSADNEAPVFRPYINDNVVYTKYTLGSSNVYDNYDGTLVAGADFTTTFDRSLSWPVEVGGDGGSFTPQSVTSGSVTAFSDIGAVIDDYFITASPLTSNGPSPTEIEFTSINAGTALYSGTDSTLAYRTWTLETRDSDSDPWTVVTTADDYSATDSQNGGTPWSSKPTLTADKQYRVKVEYSSSNARSVESDYNYFTTGPS